MVKFAHIADCHLGGWKYPELQSLNYQSFAMAIDNCIKEKVDFVLIAGDLFDTAFPGIEVLKETFSEFKRLKEAKIPCFIIAGSHDYSVSGKTFLDVLEKAGFCKNVECVEERGEYLFLNPTVFESIAIYGYPGRKSGLEVPELRRVRFNDSPGLFKIFMLHTTVDKVKGNLPIDAIEYDSLPKADYYALGHIHVDFQYDKLVYPGPTFPNNFQELEDLGQGGMYIVDISSKLTLKKIDLKIKEVLPVTIEIKDAIAGTDKIISNLNEKNLMDKIVLLRVRGELENGTNTDIKFQEIENFVKSKGAYFILKNTHDLNNKEIDVEINLTNTENIEEETIKFYSEKNISGFNHLVPQLINSLSIEKQEGETTENFNRRLMEASQKIFGY